MRILLVNKFIFPKGGAETYTFDVGKMLEEHGHEVQYFGLENEKNIVGNRVDSYVTNMDFSQGIRANLNAPFRIIYSREARKKIRAVLDDFQPDVVHLNNKCRKTNRCYHYGRYYIFHLLSHSDIIKPS